MEQLGRKDQSSRREGVRCKAKAGEMRGKASAGGGG